MVPHDGSIPLLPLPGSLRLNHGRRKKACDQHSQLLILARRTGKTEDRGSSRAGGGGDVSHLMSIFPRILSLLLFFKTEREGNFVSEWVEW